MKRPIGQAIFLAPGERAPNRIVTSIDEVAAVDMTTTYGDPTESGGRFWSLVSRYTNGASEFDFGVYEVPGDAHHARHWHPDAAELYYITEGRGFILLESGEIEARPGQAFYFPARTVHGLRTEKGETLKMVYCFSVSDYRLAGRVWVE